MSTVKINFIKSNINTISSYEHFLEVINFIYPIKLYQFKVGEEVMIQAYSKQVSRTKAHVYKVEDEYAYVIINYSFICNAKEIIAFPYSNVIINNVEILGIDKQQDIAILKIKERACYLT